MFQFQLGIKLTKRTSSKQKISQLLSVSEDESGFAFKVFKDKIVSKLNVGEAVKIDDLGVFQLKEQMSENAKIAGTKKKILVYSPSSNLKEEDSLFLTLDIDPGAEESDEFTEKVFQVGVNRPMITLHTNESEEENNDPKSQIVKKISNLVNESEKITNFDLWEDYLQGKESKSMLEEDEIEENEDETDYIDSLLEDDKTSETTQHIYENDFEELNEEEILNELMDEGNLDSEQLNEITTQHQEEELNPEEIIEPEESEELTETDFEPIEDEEVDEIIQDELAEEIKEDNIEDIQLDDEEFGKIEEPYKSFEDKVLDQEDLQEEIKDNDEHVSEKTGNENIESEDPISAIPEIENLDEETDKNFDLNEESEFDEKENEEAGDENIDLNESENLLENKLEESENNKQFVPKPKSRTKKRNSRITLLISLFIMIVAVGIYYLFLQNPIWLQDKYEADVAQQKKYEERLENLKEQAKQSNTGEDQVNKESTKQLNESTNNKDKGTNSNQKVDNKEAKINNPKVTSTSKNKKTKSSNVKTPANKTAVNSKDVEMVDFNPNETEVSKNIYYDGNTYSLQISSWKHQIYAEREAKKLINKGYSAFIVKAYVKKFEGIWHRVRIGPYQTLEKAKSIQSKLK